MTRQQDPNQLPTLANLHILSGKHIREVDDETRTHEMHKNIWGLEASGAKQSTHIEFGLSCHPSLSDVY